MGRSMGRSKGKASRNYQKFLGALICCHTPRAAVAAEMAKENK
jgi:hypothetical protein